MSVVREGAGEEAIATGVATLFVPGNRPDRWQKAATAGADFVIIDLEDAVPAADKAVARSALSGGPLPGGPLAVRINGVGTPWHDDDMRVVTSLPIAAIMIPKIDSAKTVASLRAACGDEIGIVGLVESAEGLGSVREIAGAPGLIRLAIGTIDLAADLGCAHTPTALLHARSELVLASRLAGITPPIDGITASISDTKAAENDARYARELGMGGKLCIHPAQLAPTFIGFAPTEDEIAWATRICEAEGDGALAVSGEMVDLPVRKRAEIILARARDVTSRSG